MRAFTEEEVRRLLEKAAGDREMATVVALLLVTGVRRSELLGLAWDCVDLDAGTVTVKRVVLEVEGGADSSRAAKDTGRLAYPQSPAACYRSLAGAKGSGSPNRPRLGQRLPSRSVLLLPRLGRRADGADDHDVTPAAAPAPGANHRSPANARLATYCRDASDSFR